MSTLFTTTSRWATTATGRMHSLAKRKGADVVQSALNSRPVEHFNRTVSGYDLADKANMFFSAIGAPNIKIGKKGNRGGSPAPELRKTKRKKKKKRRRTCTDHGTGTAEACRERSASSESDDTDTISESDSDSTECVDDDDDSTDCIDGDDDSIVEDTGSSMSSSSIPDMDSIDYNDDDEWVRLKYRNQEERARDGRYIDALDERFQPTRSRVRPPRFESAFAHGPGRRSAECPAGEGRVPEAKTEDGRVGASWRGVSMEAVMFVPEVPEETDVHCSPYAS